MENCTKCAKRLFHFFHDNGDDVRGPLTANTGCHSCYQSKPHNRHDVTAFNTRRALRGDDP